MTNRDAVEEQKDRIVGYLREHDVARARVLSTVLGLSERTLDRRLRELRQEHRVWSDRFGGYSLEERRKASRIERVVVGLHNLNLTQERVNLDAFRKPWLGNPWNTVPWGWCRQEKFGGRAVTFRVFERTHRLQVQVGATDQPLGIWDLGALHGFLAASLPFVDVDDLVVAFVEVALDLHGVRLRDFGFQFTHMRMKDVKGYVLQAYDKVIEGLPVLRQELHVRPRPSLLFSQALREAFLIAGEFGGGPLVQGWGEYPSFDGTGYA